MSKKLFSLGVFRYNYGVPQQITITAEYFKEYRKKLGFSRQDDAEDFFGAKDIMPVVDLEYIELLNERLYHIIDKINDIVPKEIKIDDLAAFKRENIENAFTIMKENNILPRLNNQGRRREHVYYNWMRGYVFSHYFTRALGLIFSVDVSKITLIGDDDLTNIETFKRSAKADLSISSNKMRIEIQSGFTGLNDIKKHKVVEAKKVFADSGFHTLAIHFDLYNGQVAFIKLDEIAEESMNWIKREQMEGQVVFNIDQNYFVWKIIELPPKFKDLVLE